MKTITINNLVYEIQPDNYDGDIVLTNTKQDLTIVGGYYDLWNMWECQSNVSLDYYLNDLGHIYNYILYNNIRSVVTINE